jgi:hypothetical protein
MRRRLFVLAALLVFMDAAHAQFAVVDAPSELSLVQQVATAAKQLTSLQQQYQQLTATYQQVTNQYNMLTRFANPNGVATELQQPFLRNPLPATSGLPQVFTGSGGAGSTAYTQQYLSTNQVYVSPTATPGGALMNTQANSLAALQGTATTNLAAIEQRISGLSDLQNQLNNATTIQQVASINARISAEQNYIGAQQAQASNLQTITSAQIAVQQQQRQQLVSQQAAQAASTFPVSVP